MARVIRRTISLRSHNEENTAHQRKLPFRTKVKNSHSNNELTVVSRGTNQNNRTLREIDWGKQGTTRSGGMAR